MIMKRLQHISHHISSVGSAVMTWFKVPIMSRRPSAKGVRPSTEEIVILGNGPSLTHTLNEQRQGLMSRYRLAVNFAANAEQFSELMPQFYVLADPHFFATPTSDSNVERLWTNLAGVNWDMILYVPCKHVQSARSRLRGNHIKVKGFNLTPGEGVPSLVYPLYRAGLAMPRPRNVLIPSIMLAMREGFRHIYIAGADHTWSRTLSVDDRNRVISVQPHFYADGKEEQSRVNNEYAGYRLHDILKSLYIAFRSYHQIREYADATGVRIVNITPGSFIDAFPRQNTLPEGGPIITEPFTVHAPE